MSVNLEKMTAAYIECALWACSIPCDSDGVPVEPDDDGDYPAGTREDCACEDSRATLSAAARKEAANDCAAFVEYAVEEFGADIFEGIEDSQIGHDFHLTRNHHGAGFWDRGLGEQGRKLTDAAHTFGTHGIMAVDADTLEFHS